VPDEANHASHASVHTHEDTTMLRKLVISVAAALTLGACTAPTAHHNATAPTVHNTVVVHSASSSISAITVPPMANPFDQPGYECYAQGDQVLCKAPGKLTIVKVDVFSPMQCAYYTDLVWEGKLAAEVVYDPASPCRHMPVPTLPTCADQPDTACIEADGTIR
jgi:hypothetical protein